MENDFKISGFAFLGYGVFSVAQFAVFHFMSIEMGVYKYMPSFVHIYSNVMLVIDFMALLTGYYLLQENTKVHKIALPVSVLLLLHIPLGTIVGALYLLQRTKRL